MQTFKLSNRKTLAYRFSVGDKEDNALIKLKALVKQHNKTSYTKLRVRLMARGGVRGRTYSTPHANAEYFDVYVHQRR
jgi:hypothetical protein